MNNLHACELFMGRKLTINQGLIVYPIRKRTQTFRALIVERQGMHPVNRNKFNCFPLFFFFFPSFRNDAFVFSKQIRYSYITQCNATRSDATSGSPLSLPDGAIHHPSMGIIRSAIKSLQKNRLLSSCCRSKIEMESGIIGTRGRFATGDDDGLYQAVHVGAASL